MPETRHNLYMYLYNSPYSLPSQSLFSSQTLLYPMFQILAGPQINNQPQTWFPRSVIYAVRIESNTKLQSLALRSFTGTLTGPKHTESTAGPADHRLLCFHKSTGFSNSRLSLFISNLQVSSRGLLVFYLSGTILPETPCVCLCP